MLEQLAREEDERKPFCEQSKHEFWTRTKVCKNPLQEWKLRGRIGRQYQSMLKTNEELRDILWRNLA